MSSGSDMRVGPGGRIAVVGGGIVGISVALHLRRANIEVDLFDHRGPGRAASFGNAGIIAVNEVLPIGRPSLLRQVPRMLIERSGPLSIRPAYLPKIAPWLWRMILASRQKRVDTLSGNLAQLLSKANEAWEALTRGSPAHDCLRSDGWLKLFATARGLDDARRQVEMYRYLGVEVDVLGGSAVAGLEPALAKVAGALLFPRATRVISPRSALRALIADAAVSGVSLLTRKVQRLGVGDGAAVVFDDGSSANYDAAVIAAGAWSRSLLRCIGADVPLDTERGYHLMLPTPGNSIRRPVTFPEMGYTLTQMDCGIRLTSGVEFAGLDHEPDYRRIMSTLRSACRALPGLSADPLSKWMGFRPSMPDSIPVIGPLASAPRIFAAFGHGHLGMTLGPLTGQMISSMITGKRISFDVSPYSPARFGV